MRELQQQSSRPSTRVEPESQRRLRSPRPRISQYRRRFCEATASVREVETNRSIVRTRPSLRSSPRASGSMFRASLSVPRQKGKAGNVSHIPSSWSPSRGGRKSVSRSQGLAFFPLSIPVSQTAQRRCQSNGVELLQFQPALELVLWRFVCKASICTKHMYSISSLSHPTLINP